MKVHIIMADIPFIVQMIMALKEPIPSAAILVISLHSIIFSSSQFVLVSGPVGLYGLIVLVLVLAISVSLFAYLRIGSDTRPKTSIIGTLNMILIAIAVASGSGLIIDVPALQSAGFLHWVVLLAYISILIFLASAYYLRGIRIALPAITLFSIIMVILMLIDIFGNLPYSDYYNALPGFGVKYLLGFGAPGTASMFSVSLAFVTLLGVSAVQAILSFIIWFRVRKSSN